MCRAIGRLLAKTEGFGGRRPARLLQLPAGYMASPRFSSTRTAALSAGRSAPSLVPKLWSWAWSVRMAAIFPGPTAARKLRLADEIFLYGPEDEPK